MNYQTLLRPGRLLPSLLAIGCLAVIVLASVKAPAGIQGSGHFSLYAVGTVTGTGQGSIVVSGNRYPTTAATFKIDGHPGTPGQIQVGDVVSLTGELLSNGDGYAATEVNFDGSVQGRVDGVDSTSGALFVLGQTVRVNANTVFSANMKPASLAALQTGDVVEVSAYADSTGGLVAARIQAKGHGKVARVVGVVHALAPAQHTFYINGLKVDYGSAVTKGVLSEGITVRVQGNQLAGDGALIANLVRAESSARGEPGGAGRIQGLITRYSSSAYFEVNGQPVIVSPQTQLHLAVPLGLDVPVIVAGTFDTNDALVADTVDTSE
jgi:hypothetical protein